MNLPSREAVALAVVLAATPVCADRGALTFDVGAGVAGLSVAAPYASSGGSTFGVGFEAMFGMRYAITNEVEFSAAGYFEPSVGYSHNNVTVATPNGEFSGNLTHSLYFFGLVGGVRYVTGSVWRLVVGLEAGWCHRVYSGVGLFDASGKEYNLGLQDFTTDNLVLQPLVGVEWNFADHWGVSLIPRFTVLIGPDFTVGASLLLSISYSWFL